jgi:tripartite-type tricarboxylate transporter receptor subunit TctC
MTVKLGARDRVGNAIVANPVGLAVYRAYFTETNAQLLLQERQLDGGTRRQNVSAIPPYGALPNRAGHCGSLMAATPRFRYRPARSSRIMAERTSPAVRWHRAADLTGGTPMFGASRSSHACMRFNVLGTAVFILLMTPAICGPAQADVKFPTRPVRLILPFGAGGVADLTMRLLGQKLGERWNQQVVIENKPGAGGIIAQQAMLASAPDGHAMSVTGNGTAIGMTLFKARPYDIMKDFTHVSITATFEMLLATGRDAPHKTITDVLDYARKNPGKLNLGAINPGSTQNLSAHLFKLMTGIEATVVTYRTTPELITGVLRGDIDLAFDYYAAFKGPIIDEKIRIIASADDERNPLLRNVPTAKESGLPDYVVTSWNALSAPAGLPKDILMVLNRDIVATLDDPELRQKAREIGLNAKGSTPQAMRDRMGRDIARWAEVIEKAGIPKQ